MVEEWNESCEGWTEQEHFYLKLELDAEQQPSSSEITQYSNLVTWEARDGSRFRFDTRRASNDKPFEEIKGVARGAAGDMDGLAEFTSPEAAVLPLPAGSLFPTAHTALLIERARAGDHFVAREVFDGSDVAGANLISAFIGPEIAPGAEAGDRPASPLLNRPSWRVRLAFFSSARGDKLPDFEETVQLLDDGVIGDMLLDYGDYRVRAKLERIESLPKPRC